MHIYFFFGETYGARTRCDDNPPGGRSTALPPQNRHILWLKNSSLKHVEQPPSAAHEAIKSELEYISRRILEKPNDVH